MVANPSKSIITGVSGGNTMSSTKTEVGVLTDFVNQQLGAVGISDSTIASAILTPTASYHTIRTEAAAGTDTLTSIADTNLPNGALILLRGFSGEVTTIDHGTSGDHHIELRDKTDWPMTGPDDWLLLIRDGADGASQWNEVDRYDASESIIGMVIDTPAGTINGVNQLFTCTRAYRAGGVIPFVDGVLVPTAFAETSPSAGTFTFTTAPLGGTIVSALLVY